MMRAKRIVRVEIWGFIPCHRKYSQSEYWKAVVDSTVFHRPSHHAPRVCRIDCVVTVFSMGWFKIVMQIVMQHYFVVRGISSLWHCIFLVYKLALRLVCIPRNKIHLWDVPWYTTRKRYKLSMFSTFKTGQGFWTSPFKAIVPRRRIC